MVAVLEEGDAARLALVEEAEEAASLGGGVLEAELLAKDAKLEVVEVARAVRVRVLKELLDAEERDVAVDARALHLQHEGHRRALLPRDDEVVAHDSERHRDEHHAREDGERADRLAEVSLGRHVAVPDRREGDDHTPDRLAEVVVRAAALSRVAAREHLELDVLEVVDDCAEEECADEQEGEGHGEGAGREPDRAVQYRGVRVEARDLEDPHDAEDAEECAQSLDHVVVVAVVVPHRAAVELVPGGGGEDEGDIVRQHRGEVDPPVGGEAHLLAGALRDGAQDELDREEASEDPAQHPDRALVEPVRAKRVRGDHHQDDLGDDRERHGQREDKGAGRGLPVLEEDLEAHAPVARLVRVLDPRVVPRRRVVVPEVDLVAALEALAQRHARRGAPAVGDGAALSVELRPLPEQPLLVFKVRDVRVRQPVVEVLLAGRGWARAASAAPSPRRPTPAARRLPRRRAFGGRRLPLRGRLELCLMRRLL
mmetsp:Transcript_2745/g.8539  ORF Transcript_2745/g.8539 Transcript_2745/m.8539 type:complete len:484 (-) Transcript_2745:238-1689(-)